MKKLSLVGILVVVFALYAIFNRNAVAIVPSSAGRNSTIANSGAIANSSQTNGTYKDGTYTGSAVDAFYGTIQVQAVVQNGKLTDVQFLQYPNDRSRSIAINTAAMPMLKQEAIQAQSASVDIVSGATDSSQAFAQSLASALSQAK